MAQEKEKTTIVYLKDALKNKTPIQILDMMPFMVCIETYYPKSKYTSTERIERESYPVIGVSKNSIILGTDILVDNDDDFAFSHYYHEDGYIELPLNKLATQSKKDKDGVELENIKYIFTKDCTSKQREFLVKYCGYYEDDIISGYEAYHLIRDTINDWEKQKKYYKKHPYSEDYYNLSDDDYYDMYGYDVPNM